MQAPTDPVLVHVNISDSSRASIFPPLLRFTPQDWSHPKVSSFHLLHSTRIAETAKSAQTDMNSLSHPLASC